MPEAIIRKAPSADLWPGQTDEAEAGFSYPVLDRLLFWRIDKRRSVEEMVALGFDRALVERVDRMIAGVRVQAAGPADRQARAADGRRRLPLPAAAARARRGARADARPGPRAGERPAAGCSSSRRRSATSATSRFRAIEVLRAVPLVAAEDTRLTRRLFARYEIETRPISYHARSAAGRRPELLAHLSGGRDLALVTDAGTPGVSDPGEELVRAWAAEGGTVVPDPGASAVLAAVAASGSPAALDVRGLPARGAAASAVSGSPGSRPTSGRRSSTRRRACAGDASRPRRRLRRRATGRRLPRADEAPRGDRPRPLGELARAGEIGELIRPRRVRPRGGRRASTPAAASTRRSGRAARRRPTAARWEVERLMRPPRGVARERPRPVADRDGNVPRRRPIGSPASTLDGGDMTVRPRESAVGGIPILGARRSRSPIARPLATVAVALVAIVLDFGLHADPTLLFVVSAAGILGLAWVVGLSTERLGSLTGPQVGGILNATFGNIAELIIAFFALQAGLIEVVKASLTGSIIGNLLLVLGASVLVGGLRNGTQTFSQQDRRLERGPAHPGRDRAVRAGDLRLQRPPTPTQGDLVEESVIVAVLLIVGYVLSLIFQFTNPGETLGGHEPAGGPRRPRLERPGRDPSSCSAQLACWRSCRRSSSVRSSRSSTRSACRRSSSASSSSRRSATWPSTSSRSSSR